MINQYLLISPKQIWLIRASTEKGYIISIEHPSSHKYNYGNLGIHIKEDGTLVDAKIPIVSYKNGYVMDTFQWEETKLFEKYDEFFPVSESAFKFELIYSGKAENIITVVYR